MKTTYAVLLVSACVFAQEVSGDRVTVPFSDPSRPKSVRGQLLNSCFVVEGYDGNEVIVESRKAAIESRSRQRAPRGAEGLTRLDTSWSRLTIEEQNNIVRIHGPASGGEVLVRVPRATNLKLECTNNGDMKVSNVTGDLELGNLNGNITVTGVSGSVLAHSLNGKVVTTFDRIAPDKPMSFSTLNGDIDVTLPVDTKGTLRVKSDNGETYTDFQVKLQANTTPPAVENNRSKDGKYRVRTERTMVGTINGGGPDMTFKTLNGNIFIRQKK
jgi:DUF4097 and DUF4098 domain-containing protein YvlB